MKVIRNSVVNLLLLGLIFLLISSISAQQGEDKLEGTQLTAFPNIIEAPTASDQLDKAPKTLPLLSRALSESDPQRNMRKNDFVTEIRYTWHQLTKSEAEQIFDFVDYDHKDLIAPSDWDKFVALFVLPFEACDKDKNQLLSEEEYKTCFNNDPRTKNVQFRRRDEEQKTGIIMDTITTRGKREINFSDYLFVKKALYGWDMCHSGAKYIAKAHFRCAINYAIPNKYHLKIDIDKIYDEGIILMSDKNLVELDFIGYLRISHFTYVFTILGTPHDSPNLEKTQWIKAIKEDRIPNNFEESEVIYIFELINTNPLQAVSSIDFSSWCFFYNLHKLFNVYSHDKPLHLTLDELQKLLKDRFVTREILQAIDSSPVNFTEDKYQEASLVLKGRRLSESTFFKFKQDASVTTNATNDESTKNANFHDITVDEKRRAVFFSTFALFDKKHWTRNNMYLAFQLSNLYITFVGITAITKPIPVSWFLEKLPTLYDTVTPPISVKQRNNLSIYKSLPSEIYLDLLTFLALENFTNKIKSYTMNNSMLINETVIKTVLQDFGMLNMPDTVLDTASKGFDALKRRQFDPQTIIKNTIIVHAVAAEHERDNRYIKDNKLKLNNDPSRRFSNFLRRDAYSDKV
jgi:hypothetical protein